MTAECPSAGWAVLRAARSLYINRERLTRIEGRIQRAEDTVLTYMGLYGLATARLGVFDVELGREGDLHVEKMPLEGVEQLALPSLGEPGDEGPPIGFPPASHPEER